MDEKKKILIISNNPKLQKLLCCYGYSVDCVCDLVHETMNFGMYNLIIIEDNINILKNIRKISSIPIIVINSDKNNKKMVSALNLGADDYIIKPYILPNLLARINAVIRRSAYSLMNNTSAPKNNVLNTLTKREKDVLLLVKCGESNKSIANKLVLSEITVKSHLSSIYKKLNVANRTQALLAVTGILK